jgi:tetrahydromethanopterin S-methyltransferase subunit G
MATQRRRISDRLQAHLRSRDVARVLYGAIIGLALVVALQAHPPAAGQIVVLVVGTAVAVGLAELYCEIIGTEAGTGRMVKGPERRRMAGEALAVVVGAGFPAVFFALAAAGAIEVRLAFSLSKWSGLALICGYGALAARLAGAGRGKALLHGAVVGLIGVALIELKSLLH